MGPHRIFLLSPAFCGGRRAAILLRPGSQVPIARKLQAGGLTLGEAFSFLSGLYFRGKLTYAQTFGTAPDRGAGTLVITPSRGLMRPDTLIDAELLREFAAADVSTENSIYRVPLDRDASMLLARVRASTPIVLLGSIATGKYVDVLAPWFGKRLLYPSAFVGRGDMSRGGLLLRHAKAGEELAYERLEIGVRPRGPRPAKLDPKDRVRESELLRRD
ncbi:MAG TPA: hypothetical protein VFV78_03965 [Vicinamibacterales bacterium]|nr:hypothetical protein [Vicinamibacterales bacterium]